ncbi:MAG: hypothetical protein JST54_21580 [Deltaproteobacteria bacterium]|nr:hypothetical protein [Deltaproteobacteria bacterium]
MIRALIGGGILSASVTLHCLIVFKILPSFEKLFADFGSAALPWPTEVALSSAWRYGWLAWFIGVGGLGVVRVAMGRRPLLLTIVLTLGSASWALSIFAVYLPIFTLAGTIHE